MNNARFGEIREELENKPYPAKRVNLGDIVHRGENVYTIGGKEYVMEDYVQKKLDDALGIKNEEKSALLDAGGEREITKLRNWLLARNSGKNYIVLAGDGGNIVRMEECKGDIIPPNIFFNIVETFCDRHNYNITDINYSDLNPYQVSAVIDGDTPRIVSINDGEKFNLGQLKFTWNLTSVDLKERFERLICSNGAVSTELRSVAKIFDAGNESVRKLTTFGSKEKELIECRITRYLEKSEEAMRSAASIMEVEYVSRIMKRNGVDDARADELSGYKEILDRFGGNKSRRLQHDFKQRVKTSHTVWELYNILTYITSHNVREYNILDPHQMMLDTGRFLGAQRDIAEYIDLEDVA
ncbi:MAG: hypothetical protein IJI37_07965 [Opitutales bacterium]|nr:hypothetical protein [Opitutales bacterium]